MDEDNEPLLENSQEPARTNPPNSTQNAHGPSDSSHSPIARRQSANEPRTSGNSSGSQETDLELDDLAHGDALHRNGNGNGNGNGNADVRNRASWGAVKQESWVDTRQDGQTMNSSEREKEAQRVGTKQFVQKTIINAILIALWYILSISMSVYNKWMFSPGNLDFHFPLFSTSVHMLVQFGLASLVLYCFPQFRPRNGTIDPRESSTEEALRQREPEDRSKPLMTPWFYISRIASCGAVTGLDIGLGNTSLKFISLTFFTMVKSSTLGFVLGFAILFRLESPSWKIGGIIAVMTLGVILMVSGETAFDGIGFALLMAASFFSGLRWSLTQILLRRTPATSNPFSTLFFLTPVMFFVLFILAIPVETFSGLAEGLDTLAQERGLGVGLLIVLFPGCIAFCMTSAEFALLKRTSVVTLSVCGIFKEVLTITAAGLIFGDELTPINISGLLITIVAIAVYNWTRMRKMKRMEISKARDGDSANSREAGVAEDDAVAGTTSRSYVSSSRNNSLRLETQSMAGSREIANDREMGEQAPMLSPAPQSARRTSATRAAQTDSRRDSQDSMDADADAEDVVMIQGDAGEPHWDAEPMREPVRAFFTKKPGAGYEAL